MQEFIEGQNAAEWAASQRPSYHQIARLLIGVAEAVGYAHQQGLTHCDLKLANVLIDTAGEPHVADFGLAMHESVQPLHRGEVFGTPAMMAPEQVRGESHRLDGRTDIWAMGVMLYELLVGRKPFAAETRDELFAEIQSHDPKPPRQIDRGIPRELERVCLKCLSKRRTERYNTTDDLREDLLTWLDEEPQAVTSTKTPHSITAVAQPDSSSGSSIPAKIVPKGLRSFDAKDADFFLELLPGARDREGLPESIRFWKQRIEETDPDQTFSVGLIYGPSGCGKSSLMKAGLLPRLGSHIWPVFVEATAADTEVRLLKQLRKNLPHLPSEMTLPAACAELRMTGAGRNRKVLLVIDQFEQWLHSHAEVTGSQLVDALRQCDGSRLQAIVLVRDDFYLSVNRLFQELEVRLLEGQNQGVIDLFDPDHARKVLTAFGRAYGKLREDLSSENDAFLVRAVDDLADDNKVICVRLALFADMMKSRAWVPDSLHEVGGVGGVGETFLEETFAAKTAPPSHRIHEKAVRGVLKALLPEEGTDIKGSMRPADKLREAAEYLHKPKHFEDLIQILDSEVRLITPTDPEGNKDASNIQTGSSYYQLTHDYLVPAIQDWLTQRQKKTFRGRVHLRLEERSRLWYSRSESRNLPSLLETMLFVFFTRARTWTTVQRRMVWSAFAAAPVRAIKSAGCLVISCIGVFMTLIVAALLLSPFFVESIDPLAKYYGDVAWLQATGPDELRDGESALANAKCAVELSRGSHVYIAAEAAAHAEIGDFATAIERQMVAVELAKHGKFYDGVARLQHHLGLFRKGHPVRDRSTEAEAYRHLAWTLATGSVEPAEAEQVVMYAERAWRLSSGGNHQFLRTKAAANAKRGSFDEAVRTQTNAIAIAMESGISSDELEQLRFELQHYKSRKMRPDFSRAADAYFSLAERQYLRTDAHADQQHRLNLLVQAKANVQKAYQLAGRHNEKYLRLLTNIDEEMRETR